MRKNGKAGDRAIADGPRILRGPWRESKGERLIRLVTQARNVEEVLVVRNGRFVRVPVRQGA